MQPMVRLATLAIYAIAVSGILVLGGSKYDWIAQVDPAFAASSIETDGSRNLVATLLLLAALSAMAALAAMSKTRGKRMVPLVLSLVAVGAYAFSRA
ncbi:MAG: hypothetical protein ACK4M8_04010 [Allorhizobium sp.]